MIKHVMVAAAVSAVLATPSCNAPGQNYHGANPATQRVCDDIGNAGKGDHLQDRDQQVVIKLNAAKSGVTPAVRDAIDAYYGPGGFTGANVTRLYDACKNAGAPE